MIQSFENSYKAIESIYQRFLTKTTFHDLDEGKDYVNLFAKQCNEHLLSEKYDNFKKELKLLQIRMKQDWYSAEILSHSFIMILAYFLEEHRPPKKEA